MTKDTPSAGAHTGSGFGEDRGGGASAEGVSVASRPLAFGPNHPYVVDQLKFQRLTGLMVNPAVLLLKPQGHRLLVMLNPEPEEYKGIVLPDSYKAIAQGGSGWVLAAGPLAGSGGPHPSTPMCHPEELLYQQIIFGASVGKPVRVEFLDRRTKSAYLTMTDRDIWHVDLNPSEFLPDEDDVEHSEDDVDGIHGNTLGEV